jgi:hypothetical protein
MTNTELPSLPCITELLPVECDVAAYWSDANLRLIVTAMGTAAWRCP